MLKVVHDDSKLISTFCLVVSHISVPSNFLPIIFGLIFDAVSFNLVFILNLISKVLRFISSKIKSNI